MNRLISIIKRGFITSYPEPKTSEEAALETLKSHAYEKGWTWREPIKIKSKRGKWIIKTNYKMVGVNIIGEIDQQTGEVLHAKFWPR